MKEVIDTILKAEEDAKQRIAEAREQAKKIVADAEVEARRLVEAERAGRLEETTSTVDDLKGAKTDAVRRAVQKAYERLGHVERA